MLRDVPRHDDGTSVNSHENTARVNAGITSNLHQISPFVFIIVMIERVAVHPNPPNHQRWNEAEIETTTTLTWQLGKLVASLPRRDGDVGGGGVESSSSSSQLLELQQTKNKIDTVVVVQAQPSSKLDQVIHSFSSVLTTANNKAINTAALLKACTSHLHLMQSASNPSLSLVAKDLEQNLSKVTSFYNHHQHQCATLSSLLELERLQRNVNNSNTSSDTSFSQMSDLSVILSTLSSDDDTVDDIQEKEQMVLSKLRELVETLEPLLIVWREEFERLGLEDVRRV
ncbi:predicted protein [Thalassiosira pseudonana CCMP1335]|uniref:Glycolipid transfer protein domain-containing protein n=1 Tax=Thalassiosira pseudonana TaxID=35128 RepID=B8C6A2_THAPS|nr:predicted protein [Thalassiosira pseudonana CCMP1335]EED90772.1 predicted protein [Thalassiosira pseudonana CCMP1335]